MTHKEIVAFCNTPGNITDWIIGSTNYGLGEFSAKSEQIPVEIYTCVSVSNAQWRWLIDSYITWELVETIVNWIELHNSDKLGKEKLKRLIGRRLKRTQVRTYWELR